MAEGARFDFSDTNTNAAAGFVAGEIHGRTVAALTAEIKAHEDGGRPYRVKENGEIELLERLCGTPIYRRGEATFHEALSFARFVKRFRNGTSVVFADRTIMKPMFTAILDYHPAGQEQGDARWDLFRAVLPLTFTAAWLTWAEKTGKQMTQADFAQFLEDNIPDIAEPAGALLVEIARKLEAKTDVNWQSHIREQDGSHSFTFVENVNGSAQAGGGKVTIPDDFTLALQPFEGAKQYPVKARFRYRIAGGKVSMWFDLVRMQDVLKEAFNDELLKIESELSTRPPLAAGEQYPDEQKFITPIYNGPAPVAQTPPKGRSDASE